MRVITSQHYLDDSIINSKMDMLANADSVGLTVWITGLQDDNGDDLCILADGHHTYTAAVALGIDVVFDQVEHPEGISGETLLDIAWMDGDYIYLDSGVTVW